MPADEAKMEEKRTAIQKKLREEKMKKEVIDVTLPRKATLTSLSLSMPAASSIAEVPADESARFSLS